MKDLKIVAVCSMALLLGACDIFCPQEDVPKFPNAHEIQRTLFLECLKATKSSVTTANDDEDTDDTIRECRISAYQATMDFRRVCKGDSV